MLTCILHKKRVGTNAKSIPGPHRAQKISICFIVFLVCRASLSSVPQSFKAERAVLSAVQCKLSTPKRRPAQTVQTLVK